MNKEQREKRKTPVGEFFEKVEEKMAIDTQKMRGGILFELVDGLLVEHKPVLS